jgi:coenzyme F420 hydrogenase subunit beta
MGISDGLFLPEIDDSCTNYSLYLQCYPGYSADLKKLNSTIFGKQPRDLDLGNYTGCYVGHSNDEEIRQASSSGGIVTQLLVYALERGLIDGALVVRMKKDSPLEPEPFIARSREEIISASKSKYCPVAANAALKAILLEKGKFAVVGLPCQMYGVRKAEAVLAELKDRIVLHVGLFCSHTVSFSGTECLLRRFGVKKDDVARLDYSGSGWPGFMSVWLRDGREVKFRFNRGWKAYWNVFSPFFFAPLRCLMCPDQFNELSDVSVGDCWLPEFRGHRKGEAIVIARTKVAEEMLASEKEDGSLSLMPISSDKVKESQAFTLSVKKKHFAGRLRFLRVLGRKVPREDYPSSSSGFVVFVNSLLLFFSFRVSSGKRLRYLLAYVPLPLFRLYFGLFKCVFLLS